MEATTGREAKDEGSEVYDQLVQNLFSFGSLSLVCATANESGIIQVLYEATQPLSSKQIADAKKLRERYVREILNSLATAGLVQLQNGTGGMDGREALYFVPEANKKAFNKAGVNCTSISLLAKNYSAVMKVLTDLDGPSCIRYEDSQAFDVLDTCCAFQMEDLITVILQTPGLQELLEQGIDVAEVGGGSGQLTCHLATMFPQSRFTVSDVAQTALDRAQMRAGDKGLTNVTVQYLDACQIPEELEGKFQWVFCQNVIHDLPYPFKALQGIYKALQPGGKYSMGDKYVSTYLPNNMGNLQTAAIYGFGVLMCIPESYQQPDSDALGPCWGEEKARELCTKAGFKVLGVTRTEPENSASAAVMMCEKPA